MKDWTGSKIDFRLYRVQGNIEQLWFINVIIRTTLTPLISSLNRCRRRFAYSCNLFIFVVFLVFLLQSCLYYEFTASGQWHRVLIDSTNYWVLTLIVSFKSMISSHFDEVFQWLCGKTDVLHFFSYFVACLKIPMSGK